MLKPDAAPLLQARGLTKHYPTLQRKLGRGLLKAVDGVDLAIHAGESFGIVGESGSGKSTLARLLLRLIPPSAGQVQFAGQDITALQGGALRQWRRHVQIVFQNPHSALNGRHTLSDAIGEPLRLQDRLAGSALQARVSELMALVGLPAHFAHRYPHELSGGQKQRVCIARALALNPRLVVLDEPTSALDVSVQAQILELLRDLQRERQLTYLFISHNLAVVRALCNRVAVMYLGKVLEQGDTEAVFRQPQHPYTQALLASAPRLHNLQAAVQLQGEVPSASRMPSGCRFHTRCNQAQLAACSRDEPPLVNVAPGQACACFLRPAQG